MIQAGTAALSGQRLRSVETAITKKKGIDELTKRYTPGKVEEERKVDVVEGKYEKLLGDFKNYLDFSQYLYIGGPVVEGYGVEIEDDFTPKDINDFLPLMLKYERHKAYSLAAGRFIDILIVDLYEKGYNNFRIDTKRTFPLNKLAGFSDCQIDVTKPFCIEFNGDVGDSCGGEGVKCKYICRGNVGDSGFDWVEECEIIIYGNAGDYLGFQARHSTFTLHGEVGINLGSEATDSTFKTTNKRTLSTLLRSVAKEVDDEPSGNRIIFVDENEEKVIEYYS